MNNLAYLQLIVQLISLGRTTVEEIRGLFGQQTPPMTDVELNAALDAIIASAQADKDKADKDAQPTA